MSYRYIASGLSFVWLNSFDRTTDPILSDKIVSMTNNLCSKFHNHRFGVLFNGFTEKSLGPRTQSVFGGKFPIQVDSGGLQIITLGKKITPELKDDVYRTQSKYGSLGMQFDEIPVRVVGEKSDRVNMGGRFFDPDMFDDCAKLSGKNLARQIEIYLEEKTTCRPMMIIQGNEQIWYQRWADLCLKEVPQSHWKYIAGISSGAAALGQGIREDVERVWSLAQLQVPDHMKKMFHLLGFGSMNRLIPVIEFKRAGLFHEDVEFSYDSTKHTGGVSRGQTQIGPSIVQMSRTKDAMFYNLFNRIHQVSRDVFDYEFTEEHFFNTISVKASDAHKYYGGADKETYHRNLHKYAFMLYGVWSVMHYVELMEKDEHFIAEVRPKDHAFFLPLKECKTQADYDYWKRHIARGLRSKRVETKGSSLEGFI